MGARLLLAFFGITAFAILAASAGLYAFREVGDRLGVVDTRIPPALAALELSRSAERIIAAAPALLATTDRDRRNAVRAGVATEVARLNGKLLELGSGPTPAPQLYEIESIVSLLTARLAELDGLVGRRLQTSERIRALRQDVFQSGAAVERLLRPWLDVLDGEISKLVGSVQASPPSDRGEEPRQLAALLRLQGSTHTALRQGSAIIDMLSEVSTAEQERRIQILEFQLDLALNGLVETTAGLDPRLGTLLLQQVARLRAYIEGSNAIADARRQELTLVREGETSLAQANELSGKLTAAVDRLGSAARGDIGEAIQEAMRVQRLSAQVLVALVALSLLTSIVIVWRYVGGNIVRRLSALSDGMLAIAGGRLDTPVAVQGADEIAAMGRAVEIFRRNAIDLERLLEERKETAIRLEQMVDARTRQLAGALEQQTATAQILRVISTSPTETHPVFETITQNAVSLCGSLFANVFRFDGELLHFVASHNVDPVHLELLQARYPMRPDSSAVSGRVILTRSVVRLEDALAAPGYDQRFALATGCRRMLGVPMLREGNPVGVVVVGWAEPGPVSLAHEELLKTFADQAVIAIENVRLFDEIEDKSRQLEIAARYKSHFLASASHDLRQPLHALNLFIAQLRTESDPLQRDRLIGRIDAAVGSMTELFEALLDMSKLEAGILESNFTAFPLDRMLKRIETTFADAAREKRLGLAIVPSSAWVRSDFVLLERILFNLVSNAVRYTARGGVVVGGRRRGGHLRIDVCDTGPGIAEQQQQSVFGEFYQIPASDRRVGFGLGLAIVDRLSRLLGHPIELRSRPGRGSRFSVSVPLLTEPRSATAVSVASATTDPAHDKLVLVIDDDPLVIEGMGGILRSWGCKVLCADSEETAVSSVAARRQRPDLIIADYRLADGRTGIEAIERLRGAAGLAIPAFLISGDTAPERLREASASGYLLLHKPVAPMRLRAVLNQLLKGRDATQAAE